MTGIALKILLALEKNGEMALEDIAALLPRNHGDHRDFYTFASLFATGYIDDSMLVDPEKSDSNRLKEQLLARKFFACSTADKEAKYLNRTWMISGDDETLKGQKFALSGKGSLHLSEYRSKRIERILTISSGIFVGIVVALVSAYVRSLFNT